MPVVDDLRLRQWVSDNGNNKVVIYSGVKWFRTLYMSTA